jgi:hypothetical protein
MNRQTDEVFACNLCDRAASEWHDRCSALAPQRFMLLGSFAMETMPRPPRFDAQRVFHTAEWPVWWLTEYTTAWERTKDALRRDWLATMNDFDAAASRQLARDLRRGMGFEGAPAMVMFEAPPTPPPKVFELAEPALRYGFAAASHYHAHAVWNPALEAVLRSEWTQSPTARPWSVVVDDVRRGWESARGRSTDDTDPTRAVPPSPGRPVMVRRRIRRQRFRACLSP